MAENRWRWPLTNGQRSMFDDTRLQTNVWYWEYHGLVPRLPKRGREATTLWYSRRMGQNGGADDIFIPLA
ncbi:MAG: hypothetical protein IJK87_09945 [Prevotella sp.]|nr:hypothetical protein [Prevotella sp.]